ncbi:AbrB/MazE/SpoVT family DNA-binding domain-containing protein [soil metagenome]
MRVAIRKWGNSLAVRIPRTFAADARLVSGSEVEVAVEDGRLVIAPIHAGLTLEALLAQVTPGNLHGEVETGRAVGREAW